jgi:NDP-sugar pyrophosphorylase family protein
MRAVILAGGRGTRLAPYTTVLPKPLMPVGDVPIIELLIQRLADAGITHVTLAVGHLAALMMAYFDHRGDLGVKIEYSLESVPLGTAGPLAQVGDLDETFLVMNGDLLTDLDFTELVSTHRNAGAVATVGTYRREVKIDLGVLEVDEHDRIQRYVEKPTYDFLVSMGVYAFEPAALSYIQPETYLDLPVLITQLLDAGEPVATHLHPGYWLDIGRPDDYERAQVDVASLPRSGGAEDS